MYIANLYTSTHDQMNMSKFNVKTFLQKQFFVEILNDPKKVKASPFSNFYRPKLEFTK